MEPKNFLTIAEFCSASGLGRTYVYAMLKSGKLAAVKIGRRTLIRYEDMEAWKASLTPYKPLTLPPMLHNVKDGGGNE